MAYELSAEGITKVVAVVLKNIIIFSKPFRAVGKINIILC